MGRCPDRPARLSPNRRLAKMRAQYGIRVYCRPQWSYWAGRVGTV